MISQQQLIRMVESIPPFPESVHQVLSLTASVDCAPKALVKVIEHDPILTAEVLRLVNSAYFGLSRHVTSINHAVVYVGINTVKNVAIALSTKGALPAKNTAGLDMRQFWEHSLTVGVLARLLAAPRAAGEINEANYFVAGLLHDIGKILFAHFIPQEYRQVAESLADYGYDELATERAVLGTDHCQAGAMLAEKWKLPTSLVRSIRFHHDVEAADEQSPELYATAAANLAAHLVSAARATPGAGGDHVVVPEVLRAWLGDELPQVVNGIVGLSEEIDKAKAFIEVV
ncbi:MAG: HDOD domain-containing protein [Hahellaceae bacterium]|nr:HDOD domain-containing protein [Hahellaceae bacterium]MCP5211426.1 HDOD domain-containing protein [Hahellaceae bacterium]